MLFRSFDRSSPGGGPRTQSLGNETLQEGRSHPTEEYTEEQNEENDEAEREARAGAGNPDADDWR